MAAGDITITEPVYCVGGAALKAHMDTLNLTGYAAVTVIPVSGRDDTYLVYLYTVAEA